MILALKHKGNVYFSMTYGFYNAEGVHPSFYFISENLPMWKVLGHKNTIMASGYLSRDADLLRYARLFKGELSSKTVISEVIPKMEKIFKKYGRLDENGHFSDTYFIAENDKLVKINSDKSISWINKCDATSYDSLMCPTIDLYENSDPMMAIKEALKSCTTYLGYMTYPIAVIDSKTEKIVYLEE